MIRTLAEPNLTAISGETANFLAGGEFPVPAGFTCDPRPGRRNLSDQIEFKKFGVGLAFTPVVLSEGRISLQGDDRGVRTVDRERAHAAVDRLEQHDLTIPSIKMRRAETTVEIPSGGSLAMAGMIQEQTKQQINGTARPDAAAGARRAVQEPRLRQPADRADDASSRPMSCARWRRRSCRGRTTASPTRAIPRRSCSAGSTASTAPRQGRPEARLPRQLRLHSRLSGARGDDR